MVERFIRHDKYLTHVAIISDPVYLAEPMVRTTDFSIATQDNCHWLWPCEYVEEITGRAEGRGAALSARRESVPQGVRRSHQGARGGGARRTRNDLSRVSGATEGDGAAVSRAEAPRVSQAKNPDTGEIEVLRVQGNVYLLAGGGGNVTVQVGPSGSIMVDSKSGPLTDRILAEIKKLALVEQAAAVPPEHQRRRRSHRRQREPRQSPRLRDIRGRSSTRLADRRPPSNASPTTTCSAG